MTTKLLLNKNKINNIKQSSSFRVLLKKKIVFYWSQHYDKAFLKVNILTIFTVGTYIRFLIQKMTDRATVVWELWINIYKWKKILKNCPQSPHVKNSLIPQVLSHLWSRAVLCGLSYTGRVIMTSAEVGVCSLWSLLA